MNPVIRQKSPSDAAAIHAVTAAVFLNAPHTAHTEQFIVEALRKAGALPRFGFKSEPSLVLPCVCVRSISRRYYLAHRCSRRLDGRRRTKTLRLQKDPKFWEFEQ